MTTIQIELPDTIAQAAREAGLLTPQALERLLNDALRRQQAEELTDDPLFGMWRDREDMADVGAYIRRIRASRFNRDVSLNESWCRPKYRSIRMCWCGCFSSTSLNMMKN